jgi:geranylgeranyl pyrophosphate synthase
VEQGVLAGGKRLRPILFVAAYRACFGVRRAAGFADAPALYALAASLEMIHAYSLMHDDLPCMDDAPIGRGSPTPHTIHGERATTIGGAALIPAAGLQVWQSGGALGLDPETCRELIEILARAAGAGGMVGGQGLDLLGEGKALQREELDALHRGKTGALLAASLIMGGVAAGATRAERAALELYGREIGLAFQIADDVLDATADAETLGKLPSDHTLDKSTYVLLLGVEGAQAEARGRVERGVTALREAGIASPPLEALARYVVERDR